MTPTLWQSAYRNNGQALYKRYLPQLFFQNQIPLGKFSLPPTSYILNKT